MKVIKVGVFHELSNQINTNLRFTVRKTAVISIVTEARGTQEALTEFSLVLVWMIEFLNSCVAVNASFTLGTLLLLGDEGAKFRCILLRWPATILGLLVVVWALF